MTKRGEPEYMRKHTRHEAHTPSARNASLTPGFSKARFASSRLFRNGTDAHDAAGERERGILFFFSFPPGGESSNKNSGKREEAFRHCRLLPTVAGGADSDVSCV